MTKLTGQKGPFGYDEPQYVQKSHICLQKCASTRYSRNQNQTQEKPCASEAQPQSRHILNMFCFKNRSQQIGSAQIRDF